MLPPCTPTTQSWPSNHKVEQACNVIRTLFWGGKEEANRVSVVAQATFSNPAPRDHSERGGLWLGKKKRDDDLSWTICAFMAHEWCCLFHSVASTRNLGVAPLTLWIPLILRRYLTLVCFWLWCCPARSFWLQHQLVASRCSTFAPERLIGIFWVRRRTLSRPPCVQSIV